MRLHEDGSESLSGGGVTLSDASNCFVAKSVIEPEAGVWLASLEGNPYRPKRLDEATDFDMIDAARFALQAAMPKQKFAEIMGCRIDEDKPCPDCRGKGYTVPLICGGGRIVDCDMCRSTGWICWEFNQRVQAGHAIRRERLKQGWTLRARAKHLGIAATELSAMEQGKKPIDLATATFC